MDSEERPQKRLKFSHEDEAQKSVNTSSDNVKHDSSEDGAESLNFDNGNGENDADEITHENLTTGEANEPNDDVPMSKSQLKKLRNREKWEAGRDFRKAKRRQKVSEKKARKKAEREKLAQNEAAEGENAQEEFQKNHKFRRRTKLPVAFVIDCGFDDLMMEKERISLGSQLTRCYSDNSQATLQAYLLISSWGDQLKERFDTVLNKQHESWRGVKFRSENFVQTSEMIKKSFIGGRPIVLSGAFEKYNPVTTKGEDLESISTSKPSEINTEDHELNSTSMHINGSERNSQKMTKKDPSEEEEDNVTIQKELISQAETIYLTSDSPNTLDELKPYSVYIVGGLVDKNRHKGICYKTACDYGIKTAKLPIGDYMEMQSRYVLATNHVIEIMLKWLECGDWGEAFMKVMPKRKGAKLKSEVSRSFLDDSGENVDSDEGIQVPSDGDEN